MFLGINQLTPVKSLITIKGYNSFEHCKYEAALVASKKYLPVKCKISNRGIFLLRCKWRKGCQPFKHSF